MKTFAAIAVLLIIMFTGTVSAHEAVKDGTVEALFHIEPDHVPVVGTDAGVYITLTDTEGVLDLQKCDCRVQVLVKGSSVFDANITDASIVNTDTTMEFHLMPEKSGPYVIIIDGAPVGTAGFHPFHIGYETDVGEAGYPISHEEHSPWMHFLLHHGIHTILVGGAVIYCGYVGIKDRIRIRRERLSR